MSIGNYGTDTSSYKGIENQAALHTCMVLVILVAAAWWRSYLVVYARLVDAKSVTPSDFTLFIKNIP